MTWVPSIALLAGLILLTGILHAVIGLHGVSDSNDRLKTVYEDRIVALVELAAILDGMHEVSRRVQLAATAEDNSTRERTLDDIQRLETVLDQTWKAYMATYLTRTETMLADDSRQKWQLYIDGNKQAMRLISAGDRGGAKELMKSLDVSFNQWRTGMSRLRQLQLNVARQELERARDIYETMILRYVEAMILCLVIAQVLWWWMMRRMNRHIEEVAS